MSAPRKLHAFTLGEDNRLHCEVCGLSWAKGPQRECVGVPIYSWGQWPLHLLTKQQMDKAKLQTGKLLPTPAGAVFREKSPDGIMWLYDCNQGVAKRAPTAADKAAGARLKASRECKRCGCRLRRWETGYCMECGDHLYEVEWARETLNVTPSVLILDTETTGLSAGYNEIVQIAVIDTLGTVMIDTFVKPQEPDLMFEGNVSAHDIHGITLDDLAAAPTWPEVCEKLRKVIKGRKVIIYNAAFDTAMILGDCKRHDIPHPQLVTECAMEEYAAWVGQWSHYFKSYKWQPLGGGHTALSDCRATLATLLEMSKGK